MTTDITELAQSLKAAAEKATPGEWWADEVKNEGCYGAGDDCVEGFTSYAIYGPDGQTLFDSLNSDSACISEEYDDEGHVAWDETAQLNAEFIALANPANVLALVEALEKAQQRIAVLEEAEQKLCAANVTLDARAELAERRLAEMDSRTVTVKLPVSLDFDCEMENGDYDIDEEPYLRGKVDGFNYALTKVRRLNGTAGIKWEAE
ncbi:ead/Ea22-like family protein [Klebsiella michiganensis]|uniref:ead/Ea22-like family protein n=1 Tax=Klebsiella michiganensis TaxID=1134687 RepID=UPI002930269B|nr:ead/Ea22-like family protein [Klebsiella michiganensis]